MSVEVRMPQLGESVHEGTIGKWLRAEGDTVEKYDPLLEVITDKVDTEITASHGGTLLKIVVPEGETVQVGTVLALIGEPGEAVEADAGPAVTGAAVAATESTVESTMNGSSSPSPETAELREPAADAPVGEPVKSPVEDTPSTETDGAARVSPVAARVAADHDVDPALVEGTGRGGQVMRQDVERHVSASDDDGTATSPEAAPASPEPAEMGFISPRVARLAAQHGVDLRIVSGTGRDGRITSRDVESYVSSAPAAAAEAVAPAAPEPAAPTPAVPAVAPATATPTAPTPIAAPATSESPAPPAARAGTSTELVDEIVALSPMRRAIAEHMVNSVRTSPHVTTVHEVDMTTVMASYRAERSAFAERGVRLTVTAIIIDAVARAIAEHPITNSSWTDEGIKLHRDINIGMAVAIPGGLIVPVIHNADEKSLVGVARDVRDLAERSRDKKLAPDDVQGGTFTITNYGTLGSLFGTPVINQPQAAILGTGSIKKKVVVVESDAGDTIAIRSMMYLALTFDHRILDGGTADPFMRTIIDNLENYEIR